MRTAAGLVVLLAALALSPAASESGFAGARAASAYGALRRDFRVGPGLYREDATAPSGSYSTAWPLSQALAAALSLAGGPDGSRYRGQVGALLSALDRYWDGSAYQSRILPPYGPGGDVYYDDNEWIALDLLDAAQILPQPWLRTRAERIFALVAGGWSRDRSAACPGGVYWGRSSLDRNAVSTENGALLALRLYALTHRRSYLDWARTMDAWTRRCLRGPDGLVADHIRPDGSLDGRVWSYNQGAAIAVETGLWRATGSVADLDAAQQTADAALAGGFEGDPPVFVAIFFRDLAQLQPAPAAMRAYADSAWQGLPAGSGSLLDHAALVELYARLGSG